MLDLELVEHGADGHPVDRIVDTDPHRAILVMADHRDHRMLETRIADTRQREQQLAGEPGGGTLHMPTMPRHAQRVTLFAAGEEPLSVWVGRCRSLEPSPPPRRGPPDALLSGDAEPDG